MFRDENGRELFDLPKAPRPDEAVEAPVRLLPEYDNMLLAHADRSRIADPSYRRYLFTKNLLIPASFLADGFVAGLWTVEKKLTAKKRAVRLVLTPFRKLDKPTRHALAKEGDRLLRFLEPGAEHYVV